MSHEPNLNSGPKTFTPIKIKDETSFRNFIKAGFIPVNEVLDERLLINEYELQNESECSKVHFGITFDCILYGDNKSLIIS
jgi:hypothetical protein